MWIRVPAGIRRQLGYRVKDMARQAEKLGRLGGAPDDELVRGLDLVAAQLLTADQADRRRYLNRLYKQRSRERQRERTAA